MTAKHRAWQPVESMRTSALLDEHDHLETMTALLSTCSGNAPRLEAACSSRLLELACELDERGAQ